MGSRLRSASRLAVIAAVGLAAALSSSSRAEDSASPMQFWLSQPAKPAPPAAPRARHPTFRPSAAGLAVRRAAPSNPAPTVPQAAFVVAVFGDGFGSDLARGLTDAFEGPGGAVVLDATDEASGLAQEPMSIWSDAIGAALTQAGHVEVAVMMLGSADLRPLADGHGGQAEPGSAAWREAYGARVERAAAAFRDRHVPLIWVGLPLVRDAGLASRYADLNAVVREHAHKAGASFVDSWEAFADDGGQYATSGPDVNGRDAKLRRSDGAHFTRAGARKLASFVEPDLKRERDGTEAARKLAAIITDDRHIFDQALDIDINAQIRREAGLPPQAPGESPRAKDGPVVELTAAPLAPLGRLATLAAPLALSVEAETILQSGLAPPARRGRTDDFSWPRH